MASFYKYSPPKSLILLTKTLQNLYLRASINLGSIPSNYYFLSVSCIVLEAPKHCLSVVPEGPLFVDSLGNL